jgi:N-acetylglucosamine-6-sulfatase
MAPFAPHDPITPAPSDIGSFSGYTQKLYPSFNEKDVSDKPAYIRKRSLVEKARMEKRFRLEYEALQAVDRSVGSVVDYLRTSGQLANTLIAFMSDNGVEYGEHRWVYKLVPYDESIRVPLVVRYPALTGQMTRTQSSAMVSNLDIAPTFADVAGIGDSFVGVGKVDGTSMVPVLSGAATSIRHDLLLEHLKHGSKFHVPTYCGLRTENLMYARYAGGPEEVYRLRKDPYELRNVAATAPVTLKRLRARTKELCRPLPPDGYTWP